MKVCFITFRSITYAQRAQEILRRGGIGSNLGRTPRYLEQKGCGYSLKLALGAADLAVQLLHKSGVPFGRLYCQNESGTLEAMS